MKKPFKTKPDECQNCSRIIGVNCPKSNVFRKDIKTGEYLIDKQECNSKLTFKR